jgi:hypothetical protein
MTNREPSVSLAKTRRIAAVVAGLLSFAFGVVIPASAASYVPVSGAGSTWSENAIIDWARNVQQYGVQINYSGQGSSDGRNQFKNSTVDFAVSEIPYGVKDNGVTEVPPSRPYAYMPIVAGGTSFMYHLDIGGQRVTNLRLSGKTIVDIFTGNVTRWNDPEIQADNPALALPPRQIVPVVRGDGSGTTAQLTTWMANSPYASAWDAFCAKANRATPCGTTSFYPVPAGTNISGLGSLPGSRLPARREARRVEHQASVGFRGKSECVVQAARRKIGVAASRCGLLGSEYERWRSAPDRNLAVSGCRGAGRDRAVGGPVVLDEELPR